MPFFVTRRIIEGLGLGLARRAARKLVPVVLTLGSGPSGFPRKLSRRRLKLPRQPNFGAGSWPVGLPETTFRATAEASATAVANPRRRSRALRYSGAGGWPAGLPETIFRVTAKASATLASVVLALGFPKQVSQATQAGGSWTASGRKGRFINQDKWPRSLNSGCGWPISYCTV